MYNCIKNRVIGSDGEVTESFEAYTGVRQGECLSPFLFSMYINDMESSLQSQGLKGVTIGELKLFLILYADDTVIFGESEKETSKTTQRLWFSLLFISGGHVCEDHKKFKKLN